MFIGEMTASFTLCIRDVKEILSVVNQCATHLPFPSILQRLGYVKSGLEQLTFT